MFSPNNSQLWVLSVLGRIVSLTHSWYSLSQYLQEISSISVLFICRLRYFGLVSFESFQRHERPHQSLFNISDRFCFTTSPPCGYIHKNNQKYIQKSTRLINKAITNLNWKWSIWRQLTVDIFCLPLISRPGIYFPSITIKPSFCLQPQMIKAGPGWKCIFNRLIKWHISIQS